MSRWSVITLAALSALVAFSATIAEQKMAEEALVNQELQPRAELYR